MKKSVRVRMICLCVAATVLGSALLVAAATGSPYEVMKKTLLETIKVDNATVNLTASISVDGEVYAEEEAIRNHKIADGAISYNDYGNYPEYRGKDFDIHGFSEQQNGQSFYAYRSSEESARQNLFDIRVSDREMRIAELVADLLVGDLKNNIYMTGSGDNRTLSGTMTESQMPELYDLLLDLAAGEASGSYHGLGVEVLTSYDLATMTAILTSKAVRSGFYNTRYTNSAGNFVEYTSETGYTLEENSYRVRLISQDDPLFNEYTGNGQWNTKEIEGVIYGTMYEEETFRNFTELSVNEAMELAQKQYGDSVHDKLSLIEFVGIEDIRFTYGHFEATVNADNICTSLYAIATAELTDALGNTYEVEIRIDGSLTDVGTTVVTPPVDLAKLNAAMGDSQGGRFLMTADGAIVSVDYDYEKFDEEVVYDYPSVGYDDYVQVETTTNEIIATEIP